jgi:hypothetical protein
MVFKLENTSSIIQMLTHINKTKHNIPIKLQM